MPPLHRSARLFTLGLALAGTCAAQTTLENKQARQAQTRQAHNRQSQASKSQIKANRAERKAIYARQQRRADTPSKTGA